LSRAIPSAKPLLWLTKTSFSSLYKTLWLSLIVRILDVLTKQYTHSTDVFNFLGCMYYYHNLHEFWICVSSKSRTIDPNWSFIENGHCLSCPYKQSTCSYCCLFLGCIIYNLSIHSQTQCGI
jgi:hypothetical protein